MTINQTWQLPLADEQAKEEPVEEEGNNLSSESWKLYMMLNTLKNEEFEEWDKSPESSR